MRRIAVLCCLLLPAACASGGQASPPAPGVAPPRPVEVGIPGGDTYSLALRREANAASVSLGASDSTLWPLLVEVFGELQLPVTAADADARLLRSATGKRTTTIDKQRVSRFVECPATGYGNSASGQDVYISVQAQLLRAGAASTELRLESESYVVLTGSRIQCRSTGRLEQRIAEELARRAGLST